MLENMSKQSHEGQATQQAGHDKVVKFMSGFQSFLHLTDLSSVNHMKILKKLTKNSKPIKTGQGEL